MHIAGAMTNFFSEPVNLFSDTGFTAGSQDSVFSPCADEIRTPERFR